MIQETNIGRMTRASAAAMGRTVRLSCLMNYHSHRKTRMLMTSIHRLPPPAPVNAYQGIQCGWAAKTLPSVSQGQLSPQFCKWKYSKLSLCKGHAKTKLLIFCRDKYSRWGHDALFWFKLCGISEKATLLPYPRAGKKSVSGTPSTSS